MCTPPASHPLRERTIFAEDEGLVLPEHEVLDVDAPDGELLVILQVGTGINAWLVGMWLSSLLPQSPLPHKRLMISNHKKHSE